MAAAHSRVHIWISRQLKRRREPNKRQGSIASGTALDIVMARRQFKPDSHSKRSRTCLYCIGRARLNLKSDHCRFAATMKLYIVIAFTWTLVSEQVRRARFRLPKDPRSHLFSGRHVSWPRLPSPPHPVHRPTPH